MFNGCRKDKMKSPCVFFVHDWKNKTLQEHQLAQGQELNEDATTSTNDIHWHSFAPFSQWPRKIHCALVQIQALQVTFPSTV